jgi:hypothetical protein
MTTTKSGMMTRELGQENLGFCRENLGRAERAIPDSIPGLLPGGTGRAFPTITPAGNPAR